MERGCGSSLSLVGLRTLFVRRAMDRRPSLAEGYSLGHRLFVIPHPSAYLRRPELETSQISVLPLARRLRGILCLWRHRKMNYRELPKPSFRYTVSFKYDRRLATVLVLLRRPTHSTRSESKLRLSDPS
jgi:hypothetical protein